MKSSTTVLTLMAMMFCTQAAWAETSNRLKTDTNEIVQLMTFYYGQHEKRDEKIESAFKDFVADSIAEENSRRDQLRNAIWWSDLSSNITFVVAHVLLFVGFAVAYRQFKRSEHLRIKGKEQPIDIELKLEGMAMKGINSAYLILVAALFFYLMYLKFVYPVVLVG